MERREAVKYISILLGGSIIGAEAFLSGCKSKTGTTREFTADRVAYLNEVGETILPATSTPGAKAANVGQTMAVIVNDCYEKDDQDAFQDGVDKIDEESNKSFNKKFMELTPDQRKTLFVRLDKEANDYQKTLADFNNKENEKAAKDKNYKKERKPAHYFTMLKQLTLLGFFTSEVGCTKALRYNPVPGKYQGDIPYKKGDRAWA